MIPWLFLAVSLVGAGFTAAAWVRARRLRGFAFPYFMGAWLTDELALHHLAWQAVATGIFVATGALDTAPGRLGLVLTAVSWAGLLAAHLRSRPTGRVVGQALAERGVGQGAHPKVGWRDWWRPFRMRREGIVRVHDVPYRPRDPRDRPGRHLLDVLMPAESDGGKRPQGARSEAQPSEVNRALRPALLQVHGGAWVIGDKRQQGLPLMHWLAARGWVCFAQNYRLCPRATFPDPIVDVKRALAWIRDHAGEYGIDPDFVCVTGGSAGGHLAALAALTANDPAFQPGFEEADTRVAACVPFYGVYDFLDRHGVRGRQSMTPFLERYVLKRSPETHRELWESASPLARVHPEAPPFFVLHGSHDSLVFVEEARLFVEALREKSLRPVLYAELPGAQHAFDLFHSPRSVHAVRAVAAFLEHLHQEHRREASHGRL